MKNLITAALLIICTIGHTSIAALAERKIHFTYHTTIGPFEKGAGPIHVFIPLAQDTEQQTILSRRVTSTLAGSERREPVYGNEFWHSSVDEWDGGLIQATIEYALHRRPFERPSMDGNIGLSLSQFEKTQHARFLNANEKVPVGASVLGPILADIRRAAGSQDLGRVARAIYDWLVDNVEYKKVGTGWGNGDTYWACQERYGNCTDFHSLFNSLARTEGIAARFEIGFPIKEGPLSGEINGYHCWSRFFLPSVGWIPIDASEASKFPKKKDAFYGSQATDRIHFTTGRDLNLGYGHLSGPLNYFIYPHVEVDGQLYDGKITNQFSYRDLTSVDAAGHRSALE